MAERRPIDPRGPRFAASVTSLLLLVATLLALLGISTARADSFGWFSYRPLSDTVTGPWALPAAPLADRIADLGFLAVSIVALLFLWGVLSPRTAPWSAIYRSAIQPRLAPPTELEDPRPPRFAQGVGLLVTGVGLLLHLGGVPYALPVAAGMAFIAAFLNAVFGLCLGCRLWLLLQRAGVVGRAA